ASSCAARAGRGVATAVDVADVAAGACIATPPTLIGSTTIGDLTRRRPTMRRLRRAKIVATLGPASSSAEMIARLFEAGADVFRINMSHTSQERMRELVGMIRAVERDTGRPIGILIDLQGPKLRLGTFTGGAVTVKAGDSFVLDSDPAPGDA